MSRPKRRPRAAIIRQQQPERRRVQTVSAGPKVVQLNWRLPARLRRPVREELQRQRVKQVQHDAIVRFEKRPITTTLPPNHPHYQSQKRSEVEMRGVEQHTADIYRDTRPAMQIAAPPYAGMAMRSVASYRPEVRRRTSVAKTVPVRGQAAAFIPKRRAIDKRIDTLPRVPASKKTITQQVPVKKQLNTKITQLPKANKKVEREPQTILSLDDKGLHESVIQEPRRRFALPLHFSIFPLQWGSKQKEAPAAEKKRVVMDSVSVPEQALERKKKLYIRPLT